MTFQSPLKIKEVIEEINSRKYLLPCIQREFVWDTDRIIKLFDSIMKGYPIGSFLFWKLKQEDARDYVFYEFVRDYVENQTHNETADINGLNEVTNVLDGQQRLTSLYIALKGSFTERIPRKRNNPYVKKELYLDIINLNTEDDDLTYRFNFLSSEELCTKPQDSTEYWFKVGEVLNFNKLCDVSLFLREKVKVDYSEILETLFENITKDAKINYYLELTPDLDKVLDIFVRVNSGGVKLSYSDLLLSTATAKWSINAREEILELVDEINDIGAKFNFDKDVIVKASLVMIGKDPKFKAENFKNNSDEIEKSWPEIKQAIRTAVTLISNFGFNGSTLTANNAIIPIAYYIYLNKFAGNFTEKFEFAKNRGKIHKWLTLALLKRQFGASSDSVLKDTRSIIDRNKGQDFPFETIKEHYKNTNKSLDFTEESIEAIVEGKEYRYGSPYAYFILSLLYENLDHKRIFEQDHIIPKSFFDKKNLEKLGLPENKIFDYQVKANSLANLQLLTSIENQSKKNTDFEEWISKKLGDGKDDFLKEHFIPADVNINLNNFEAFIEARNAILVNKLKQVLLN